MSAKFDISFANSANLEDATAILLQVTGGGGPAGQAQVDPSGVLAKATKVAGFAAKSMSVLDVLAPQGSDADRIVVIGLGKPAKLTAHDWLRAGGAAAAQFKKAEKVVVYIDALGIEVDGKAAADFALGLLLR